jgi:hypothetical protein
MASAYDQEQRRQPSTIATFIRWLKLKNYQYEVTFSLYMLSPTERVIFSALLPFLFRPPALTKLPDVIILTLFSFLVMAASMYLPDHVYQIYTRIWYYVHGNNGAAQAVKDAVVEGSRSLTSQVAAETARRVGEL